MRTVFKVDHSDFFWHEEGDAVEHLIK